MLDQSLNCIIDIIEKSEIIANGIKIASIAPNEQKKLERYFQIAQTERLVGRSAQSLKPLDNELKIKRKPGQGYTLAQVNQFRDYFHTQKRRAFDEPCFTLAFHSLKGGVCKSTMSVHMAQFLGIQGYRVLLVDCDPQATATQSFGFIPDHDFSEKNTIIPFLTGLEKTLDYAILPTFMPQVSIIPACLELCSADHIIGSFAKDARPLMLKRGLDTIKDNFDIIIVDGPPAAGNISLNIMYAADGLIIPTPPNFAEFTSTTQYLHILAADIAAFEGGNDDVFVKILATRADTRVSHTKPFLNAMRKVYKEHMLDNVLFSNAYIQNLAAVSKSIYEIKTPKKKDLDMMNGICGEIEELITKTWPSHRKANKRKVVA